LRAASPFWWRRKRLFWSSNKAAIEAAIALPWSNGLTEGQIRKPKLVNRQMYGRGNLDLLQARIMGLG
jgi:transposase